MRIARVFLLAVSALPSILYAHGSNLPSLQHAAEHAWLGLVVLPLMLLLPLLGRC